MQSGHVLESWNELKRELIKMFDRRISFTAAMQKIEVRESGQGIIRLIFNG